MDDLFYCANGRWIVESYIPFYQEAEALLTYEQPNMITPGSSTTVNGYQIGHTLKSTEKFAEFIVQKTNSILQNYKYPAQLTNHIQTWSIHYYPGGWKGLHNHQKDNTGATAVLYFDDIPKQPNDEGAFYAILQNEYGDTCVNYWNSSPGKLLVMDSRIWHGVYPTNVDRRVMVLDFEVQYG